MFSVRTRQTSLRAQSQTRAIFPSAAHAHSHTGAIFNGFAQIVSVSQRDMIYPRRVFAEIFARVINHVCVADKKTPDPTYVR